jgi:hypothetical protein
VAQNEWKITHIYFSTFGSKKFEREKSEKNLKDSKNLEVAGNNPNI